MAPRRVKSVAFDEEETPLLRRVPSFYSYSQSMRADPSPAGSLSHGDRAVRRTRSSGQFSVSSRASRVHVNAHVGAEESTATSTIERERVWYNNFTSIDWIRDNVRHVRRAHRLRADARQSVRGRIVYLADAVQGWLLCFVVGIATATVAYVIMVAEDLLFSLKSGRCVGAAWRSRASCTTEFRPWSEDTARAFAIYLVSACALALVAALLTALTRTTFPSGKRLAMAAGSGIPEVKAILSGFVIHGFLGFKTLCVKSVGLTLAVATGMNLGKEGPFVHIACCIANTFSRLFPKVAQSEVKRREMLSAACAAGVAVAFGAPLGGILFALEEVSIYFGAKVMWRTFFASVTAAVWLKTLNPHGTGKLTLLETSFDQPWSVGELPFYVLLGVLGGIFGGVFCVANIAWSKRVRMATVVGRYPLTEAVSICALTAVASYWNTWTRMSGIEMVSEMLTDCNALESGLYSQLCPRTAAEMGHVLRSLLVALALKVSLTIVTFGCKVPAGIFIPCLATGALYGRVVGLALQHTDLTFGVALLDGLEVNAGIYAMIGAASALAGVTRMTISLVVIMLELTNSLQHVLPVMVAVLVAKWVAECIEPRSIYELLIELNDHPYIPQHATPDLTAASLDDLLPNIAVTAKSTIDVTDSPTVSIDMLRFKVAAVRLDGFEDGGLQIVKDGILVGYVSLADLSLSLDLIAASKAADDATCGLLIDPSHCSELSYGTFDLHNLLPIVDTAPLSVARSAAPELAYEMFTKLGLRYLAVHDQSGRFVGTIHKKRLVRFVRALH